MYNICVYMCVCIAYAYAHKLPILIHSLSVFSFVDPEGMVWAMGQKTKILQPPKCGHVQYTLSNLRESRFWQPRFITHQWRCSEYRNNIFETFNSKYCDRKYRRPVTFGMTTRDELFPCRGDQGMLHDSMEAVFSRDGRFGMVL